MTDYPVSNDSEFTSARAAAVSGDTITLANGTYAGGWSWNSKTVGSAHGLLTVQAANQGQASISSRININGCSGIKFSGVNCASGYEHTFGTNSFLTFEYAHFGSLHRMTSSNNIIIQYCEIVGPYLDMDANSSDILIQENYMRNSGGDTAKMTGGCSDITWLNNVIFDIYGSAADPHWDLGGQGLAAGGATPSNITYRGNIIIDDPATDIIDTNGPVVAQSQGVFLGDGGTGYTGILVEQNMVWVQNANGLILANSLGTNYIRNNSLISGDIISYNAASPGFDAVQATDNIVREVVRAMAAPHGGTAPNKTGSIEFSTIGGGTAADVFEDPGTTTYDVLDYRRFIPKAAYSTKGAAARIAEIQAGTNVYALNLAGMAAVGGGSPSPSISGLTINLASA